MTQSFDLLERVSRFGEDIIDFCRSLNQDSITKPLINQLIRSGTSIGANYHEANECNSKKDFINKIAISKKEAKETIHWLRMIAKASPEKKAETEKLSKETHEFVLIFSASIRTANEKLNK